MRLGSGLELCVTRHLTSKSAYILPRLPPRSPGVTLTTYVAIETSAECGRICYPLGKKHQCLRMSRRLGGVLRRRSKETASYRACVSYGWRLVDITHVVVDLSLQSLLLYVLPGWKRWIYLWVPACCFVSVGPSYLPTSFRAE